MSEQDPRELPEDDFFTLESISYWEKQGPGPFIAALLHEIASCNSAFEAYSKVIFDNIDMSQLEEEKALKIREVIQARIARLRHLVILMHEYRKTLKP